MRQIWAALAFLTFMTGALLWGQGVQLPPSEAVIRHLNLELNREGIEPRTVTVEEGWWLIRLRNGIFTGPLDLQLDDALNARVATGRSVSLAAKTSMIVNLRPGRYVFRVPGKAGWQADIQVQGKAR